MPDGGSPPVDLDAVVDRLAVAAAAVRVLTDPGHNVDVIDVAGGILDLRDAAEAAAAAFRTPPTREHVSLRLVSEVIVQQANRAMTTLADAMSGRVSFEKAGGATAWPLGYAEMLLVFYHQLGFGSGGDQRTN